MHLDASSSAALANSLDKCVVRTVLNPSSPLCLFAICLTNVGRFNVLSQDPEEPAFNTLVRILATRCMLSAEYICSGSVSKDSFLHYGLASPIYTRKCLLLRTNVNEQP